MVVVDDNSGSGGWWTVMEDEGVGRWRLEVSYVTLACWESRALSLMVPGKWRSTKSAS